HSPVQHSRGCGAHVVRTFRSARHGRPEGLRYDRFLHRLHRKWFVHRFAAPSADSCPPRGGSGGFGSRLATASANSNVDAVPPRSRVRTLPSDNTDERAAMMRSAAATSSM